jgi:Leucine-rich repeat (LRR) protein
MYLIQFYITILNLNINYLFIYLYMQENSFEIFTKRNEKEIVEMQKFFEENLEPNFMPDKIELLDFAFLGNLKNLKYFYIFKKLKELNIIFCELITEGLDIITQSLSILRLVSCNINEITKDFTKLKNLEILSLGENSIKEIKNLNSCVRIKKLYLYSNQISKIEFLQDCVLLEELDLSDNLITKVENLDSLNYLKVLNLGANKIETFHNVTHIKYIYSLREFRLCDEIFGDNPICQLEEYEYNIFKLNPNIEILDYKKLNKSVALVNGAVVFDKFINKTIKYNTSVKDELSDVNQELVIINQFQKDIDNLYKEKIATNVNLYENTDKVNIPKIYMNIEKGLEKYKSCISKDEKINIEDLSSQVNEYFESENKLFELYFEFYIHINNVLYTGESLKGLSYNLQIMDFEHIYDFYKKFFPEKFAENTKMLPLIILKFNPKSSYEEETNIITESFIDFNNYSYFLIEDIINHNFEYILQTIVNNKKFLGQQKNKFFNLAEIQQKHEKIAVLIYNNDSGNIEMKYLIYLFSISNASKFFVIQDNAKINKPTELFNLSDNENRNKTDDLESLISDIRELETLDEKIFKKEQQISILLKENNDLINDLLLNIN